MDAYSLNLSSSAMISIGIVAVLYVLVITLFGGYFSRFNKNINDFFYSGQRFAWWIPAASMVATGIGSYSFLKYSEQGFNTGMSSTMTYMNDWFILPFFIFGWLPIIYFSRIKSIPEYFERRFNRLARYISLVIILAYMFFYIGYNLYTIGIAIEGMFGIPQIYSLPILAAFLGAYVTFGGQTAVIFTDLFQGVILYIAGFITIGAGIYALGGFDDWWGFLPQGHRLPFVHLTENYKFNTSGLFWGEALAGSIAFTFMNQGFIMRYLTIKSVDEGRKAGFFNVLVTLPVSALIVGSVGWIGKSIVTKQAVVGGALEGLNLISIENSFHTFLVVCWETLYQNPWIFGFIVAALLAALMSTIDTFINACAAIVVYDLYKPLISNKTTTDRHFLVVARWASVGITFIGLMLVLWFNVQKGSLMSIHYKGIMIIIPSIVTTIFLGILWKGFTAKAACISMIVGSIFTVITVWLPECIDGLSWFVSGPQNNSYIYMRALFGMSITAVIGIGVSFFTQPHSEEKLAGLTVNTISKAVRKYKGGEPNYEVGKKVRSMSLKINNLMGEDQIFLSPATMQRLKAKDGDMVYMEDGRWFLGGLRSVHAKAYEKCSLSNSEVELSDETRENAYLFKDRVVSLEKIL